MLCGPGHPLDDVVVDVVIARGQDLVDVLAHEVPLAAPGCDAPAAPEIELTVDDGLPRRGEDDAGILPPLRVMEPPVPHIPGTVVHRDAAIEIQVAEVFEAQKRRRGGEDGSTNPDLLRAVTVKESLKELVCPELGTTYKALSADDLDGVRIESCAGDLR